MGSVLSVLLCRYPQRERVCRALFRKVMRLCRLRALFPHSEEKSKWLAERIREKVQLYDKIRAFGMPTTEYLCKRSNVPDEAQPE
jgi:hypothetical protein